MAKVQVILNCQWDNGKTVKQPGETVSIEKKDAIALEKVGMVSFPAKATVKPVKIEEKTASSSPKDEGSGSDPDDLDDEGDGENSGADDLDPDELDEGVV